MVNRLTVLAMVALLPAFGDFSYQEKSQMTGGAAATMMKALGPFMKKAREPITSAVYIKGNKMARVTAESANIIDLDAETITEVHFQKKTYSVVTFQQMKEAMERGLAQAQQQKQQAPAEDPKAKVEFKLDVKETGQQKNISGIDCKEFILTTQMEGTNTETGQSGTMTMTQNIWLGAYAAGYDEVREFHKRMAMKMASSLAAPAAMMAMNPQFMKGAAEMAKEAQKLQGMHVLTVTRMTGAGGPGQAGSAAPAGNTNTRSQQTQQAPPDKGTIADSVVRGQLGRIGLGGLGRRKKTEDAPPPPPPPPPAAEQQQAPAQGAGEGVLMEMTMETFGWTSAPVDPSKFQVPGGFKQEESPMLRGPRR